MGDPLDAMLGGPAGGPGSSMGGMMGQDGLRMHQQYGGSAGLKLLGGMLQQQHHHQSMSGMGQPGSQELGPGGPWSMMGSMSGPMRPGAQSGQQRLNPFGAVAEMLGGSGPGQAGQVDGGVGGNGGLTPAALKQELQSIQAAALARQAAGQMGNGPSADLPGSKPVNGTGLDPFRGNSPHNMSSNMSSLGQAALDNGLGAGPASAAPSMSPDLLGGQGSGKGMHMGMGQGTGMAGSQGMMPNNGGMFGGGMGSLSGAACGPGGMVGGGALSGNGLGGFAGGVQGPGPGMGLDGGQGMYYSNMGRYGHMGGSRGSAAQVLDGGLRHVSR